MKYQSALEKAAIVPKRTMENSEIKETKRKLIISISIESVRQNDLLNNINLISVYYVNLFNSTSWTFEF